MSFSSSATSLGGGWPSCLASIGLGSRRSTWLGPPCMKSWMTAFARAGACGGRGRTSKSARAVEGDLRPGTARFAQKGGQDHSAEAAAQARQGLAAGRAVGHQVLRSVGHRRAPVRFKSCMSIDVGKFVRAQEHLAQVGERAQPGLLACCRRRFDFWAGERPGVAVGLGGKEVSRARGLLAADGGRPRASRNGAPGRVMRRLAFDSLGERIRDASSGRRCSRG